MNYRDTLINYTPEIPQEIADKETMLRYDDIFDDMLTRENALAHFTASSFVVNGKRDKTLMIYHNIYDSWAWTGGHADGMDNMRECAIKELMEETGVKNPRCLSNKPISIDIVPVYGHMKRGKYVSSHLHYNITYLIECDEDESLIVNPEENSGVKWIPIKELDKYSKEDKILAIYKKIISRI